MSDIDVDQRVMDRLEIDRLRARDVELTAQVAELTAQNAALLAALPEQRRQA